MIRKKEIQTRKIEQQNKINQTLPNKRGFRAVKFNSSSTHCFTIANKKTVRNYSCSSDYERQQQNCRIIKRIINPKRDKTILRSYQGVGKLRVNKSRAKTEHRNRSTCLKQRGTKEYQRQRQRQTHNMCTQQYDIKLENQRMGNRIMNTKSKISSIVPEGNLSHGKIKNNSKINKGVFVFFNEDIHIKNRKDQQQYETPSGEPQIKQYYGFGPTILCITSISICTNPMLRQEDMVFLQLVVNSKSTNKAHQTHMMSYEILKSTKIKFALSLSKIGQFVPLRLWRVNGVNNIEIGIVDIQFSKYIEQENKIKNLCTPLSIQSPIADQEMAANIERNKEGKIRVLGKQKIQTKLRKSKVDEIEGTVCIQYMIYRKKYF